MAKPLPDQIGETEKRLSQLKARQRLKEQAEKSRARRDKKREEAKSIASLLRTADAHRKITLGGVVIAAGAGGLDPAELCGWLLSLMSHRVSKPEASAAMRERGLRCFSEREMRKP